MRKSFESVMSGNPDKVCDQIADAIVDEYIKRDKTASIDINVLGSHGMLMIGGEVNSDADFDIGELAKNVYRDIGYTDEIEVFVNVDDQSEEMKRVKNGVTDNVVINGYATSQTREMLPHPVVFAHNFVRRIDDLRKIDPSFSWLRPDGKVQIVMEKNEVKSITILASHHLNVTEKNVQTALLERLIEPLVGDNGLKIIINPLGPFTIIGFRADSGVSGSKVAVDTYGGLIPHGDFSLSGKDPMRVDRAGAYMARYVARYLVEQELCKSAMINLVYAMGQADPVHIHAIGMSEKSRGAKTDLTNLIKDKFDFRPEAIVERLGLRQSIYRQTAVYGHFGREGFPWEVSQV